MPNPQVHVAIGMGVFFLVALFFYPFYREKNLGKVRWVYLLPLFVLVGGFLSVIPDIPELSQDFPSIFEPAGIYREDKPAWNKPVFNVFFFHPWLDARFPERYDNLGLFLVVLVFNGLSVFYCLDYRFSILE